MTLDDFDEFEHLALIATDLAVGDPYVELRGDVRWLCKHCGYEKAEPHAKQCIWRRARDWRARHVSSVGDP